MKTTQMADGSTKLSPAQIECLKYLGGFRRARNNRPAPEAALVKKGLVVKSTREPTEEGWAVLAAMGLTRESV